MRTPSHGLHFLECVAGVNAWKHCKMKVTVSAFDPYNHCHDEIAKVTDQIQSRKTSTIRSLTTPKKEPNDDSSKREGSGGNNKVIRDAIWENLSSKERKQLVSKIKNQHNSNTNTNRGNNSGGGNDDKKNKEKSQHIPFELWKTLSDKQKDIIHKKNKDTGDQGGNTCGLNTTQTEGNNNSNVQNPGSTLTSPRSCINTLQSHLRVTYTTSRSLSRSHQICQMNQAGEIPSTFHRCIDGGADTGLFNKAHCHIKSVTERHADIHMVRSKGHRSNMPIRTVLITVQPPLEENQ